MSIISEINRMKFTNAIASNTGGFDFFTRNSSSTYINALQILGDGNAIFAGNVKTTGAAIGTTQADGDYLAKLYTLNADGFMSLYTGQATPLEKVRITSYGDNWINPANGGNVGIGTTLPQSILSLSKTDEASYTPATAVDYSLMLGTRNGNAAGTSDDLGPGIVWKYNDSGGGYTKKSAGIMQVGEGNYLRSGLAFYTNNNADQTTVWSEKMRLSMDGNVGIGTTSPNNPFAAEAVLQVGDTSSATNDGLITIGSGTAGSGDIYFADGTSGGSAYRGFLSYKHNGDYLAFGTAETTRIIIDSSGNEIIYGGLTVGATSQVAGTQVAIVGGGVTNLQRWGSTSDGGNQASYRFRIDQSYKFIANNGSGDNLTIDSSNGSIIPSGGIYLGGTAAVHKLDYYEEGTFIPYLEFGGNRVGIVYGSTAGSTYQGGNYTRIGRVVTFSLRIILSSKGTSVGTATIVGLPYTVGGQPANYGSAMYSFANNFLIPERPTITIDTGSSIIRLRYVNSPSGGYANVTDSGFNNNSDIILTGTYQTS